MQGGETESAPAIQLPAPPASAGVNGTAAPVPPPPPSTAVEAEPARPESSPVLPAETAPEPPAATTTVDTQPQPGATTWYRSDHERNKSVRRLANPWYRQIGRGLVALTVLGALGVGLYFGARAVQDYLNRDRLPSPGADVPEIRATSFQVRSSAPAPEIDGTLTIDTASRAFEFTGRNGGPQSGIQAVSPDGSTVYIRTSEGDWQYADPGDPLPDDLLLAVRYLSDDDTSDAILTNRLRRGYVELTEQATEGLGDNELTRYELELDTLGFSTNYPLQWMDFQSDAIPGVQKMQMLPVVIWLDTDKVLVRVRDEWTNWSWQRLAYDDRPFVPIDPSAELLEATTDEAVGSDEG